MIIEIKKISFEKTNEVSIAPIYNCTINVEFRENVTGTYAFKTYNNKWNTTPRNICESRLLRLISQEKI